MTAIELVVAVGENDQSRDRVDPATEQRDHVERRLVRPVQILEHQDRLFPRSEFADERCRDCLRLAAFLDDVTKLAPAGLRDVEQGTEWTRREERVARAPENPRRLALILAKSLQQSGLADTGLSGDESQPTAGRLDDAAEGIGERVNGVGTLEKLSLVARRWLWERARPVPPGRWIHRFQAGDIELVDALRPIEILEPVLAEVAQGGSLELCVLEDGRGCQRDEDLAPVSCSHDPGRAVHAEPVVALGGGARLGRVDPHSYAQLASRRPLVASQRPLGVDRCAGRLIGARKGKEKRVSLVVDLLAGVGAGSPAQDLPVVGERLSVPLAQTLQQPRRPFDIREESDGSSEQRGHARLMEGVTPCGSMSSSGAAIVPRRCDADKTASQLDVDVYPDEYHPRDARPDVRVPEGRLPGGSASQTAPDCSRAHVPTAVAMIEPWNLRSSGCSRHRSPRSAT